MSCHASHLIDVEAISRISATRTRRIGLVVGGRPHGRGVYAKLHVSRRVPRFAQSYTC